MQFCMGSLFTIVDAVLSLKYVTTETIAHVPQFYHIPFCLQVQFMFLV